MPTVTEADERPVVLLDREAEHRFAPSLLWLMTGGRDAARISRPFGRLVRRGIEVVRGDIERIDPANRSAVVNGRTLSGDHLVIALGAELAPKTIPGLAEARHSFYTLRGAEGLRGAPSGHGRPSRCPFATLPGRSSIKPEDAAWRRASR